jgi:antitoxin component YwqK of YwqJK toxin-antitoxin module
MLLSAGLCLAMASCMDRGTDPDAATAGSSAGGSTASSYGGAKAAVNLDDTRIQITWNAASGIVGYRIYEMLNDGSLSALRTVPPSATSFIHSGLTACTEHNYIVRIVNSDGTTDSNLKIVSAMTFAGATSAVSQLSGNAKVNFSACLAASVINVYCKLKTDPAFPATPTVSVAATSTSATVTGLSFALPYVCKALAVQADTGLEDSNTKTVSFGECPGLSAHWDADSTVAAYPAVVDRASTNNGTYVNGAGGGTDMVAGSSGNGFSFNGTNQYITVPTANALNFGNDFTIALWIKNKSALPSTPVTSAVFSKWGFNNISGLNLATNWMGLDISSGGILNNAAAKGFWGSVFDGRYVYYVPSQATSGYAARYDTQAPFGAGTSWTGVDMTSLVSLTVNYKGYYGGVFDGRYVYFAPYNNGAAHALMPRYDTQGSFTVAGSWSGVDPTSLGLGGSYVGFTGAVFDGRYVYYVPNNANTSGFALRYDTQGSFSLAASWTGVDMTSLAALGASYKGYMGGVFDGRYVYYVPYNNGAYHGLAARYDTQGSFTATGSWTGVDISGASAINNANYKGYVGAVFDGRYIYYIPYNNAAIHGNLARYDTTGSFTATTSWAGVDMTSALALNSANYKGFMGGVFDGRYIYFVSYNNGAFDGIVPRYDTQGSLTSSSSWTGVDMTAATILNSVNYKGFAHGVFDGRYVYFIPNNNGAVSGNAVRYDAADPAKRSYTLTTGGQSGTPSGFRFRMETDTGSYFVKSSATVAANTWTHVVARYSKSGGTLKLYVGGTEVDSISASGSSPASSADLQIGRFGDGTFYYNGALDEIMVFDHALSAAEIITLSNPLNVCR